jgi:histidine ammonia-lyase
MSAEHPAAVRDPSLRQVVVGQAPVTIEEVVSVARRGARVRLWDHPSFLARHAASRKALLERLARDGIVYGVTTGFGDSCETDVRGELVAELPMNLFRFHGCGVGESFSPEESGAILLARLASLAQGYSAVRLEVLQNLVSLINGGALPVIPSQGSVGASGDLTPLSYVAAVLAGEREVYFHGNVKSSASVLAELGIAPLQLEAKESLALMNGTSAMTGVACLSVARAERLVRWAAALTAMASDVLGGEPRHFDSRIFDAKPHPGQALVARWIREDIEYDRERARPVTRVQDRYSVRCAPHVLGVLVDALPEVRRFVETELNGANDNPLIDPETGDVLHGGNFYGGHVCHAMDSLKTLVANVGDLLDRQLVLLCHPNTNNGLPANLVGLKGPRAAAHHGFKAMQITTSALVAEAAKLTMPASVFSRSTENHNQDKVSMGTIAARDAVRVLDMVETVAAIHTLALAQAVDLREGAGCHRRSQALHAQVRALVPQNLADRRMDGDIAAILELHRSGRLDSGFGGCGLAGAVLSSGAEGRAS